MNLTPPQHIDCAAGVIYLYECHSVTFNGQTVGRIELHKEGLYWIIGCVCSLENGPLYRLTATTDKDRLDLGTLIVYQNRYVLNTRISTKKAGNRFVDFQIKVPGDDKMFIPVYTDKAFEKFDILDQAAFVKLGDQPGLQI